MRRILGTLLLLSTVSFALVRAQETDLDAALEAITFRPIDAIVDTELIVTNFANDGSATLPITTSIPVACTLVYGTTPEFGMLTLDQDMAGGTHSDHNPLLTGLEPETTYYFRVQGIDDAGIIYVSEVMTFTTPPRSEVEVTNLLSPELGAEVIGVSSNFGGAANDVRWGILSAFDDNPNSAWSTDGDGSEAWFEVRLGELSHVTEVEFRSRFMSDGTAIITEFVLIDDSGTTHGPFSVPDPDQTYSFEVDFVTETLRFEATDSTGGNTGAVYIAVYGESAVH